MAQTNLTRTGTFRSEDASVVESKLAAFRPVSGNLSPTGMLFIFPNGLTAPQQTSAQTIINAHVALADNDLLNLQQKVLIAYLKIAGTPSGAQNIVAIRTLCRMMIKATYKGGTVDGVDVEV